MRSFDDIWQSYTAWVWPDVRCHMANPKPYPTIARLKAFKIQDSAAISPLAISTQVIATLEVAQSACVRIFKHTSILLKIERMASEQFRALLCSPFPTESSYCLQCSVPFSVVHLHGDISSYVSNGLAFANSKFQHTLPWSYNTNSHG